MNGQHFSDVENAHTSNRSVIPRLHDDYEELNLFERNPVDDELAMKRWLSERFP